MDKNQYASEAPSLTDLLKIPEKTEQKKPATAAGVKGVALGLATAKKPMATLKLKPVEKRSASEAGLSNEAHENRESKAAKVSEPVAEATAKTESMLVEPQTKQKPAETQTVVKPTETSLVSQVTPKPTQEASITHVPQKPKHNHKHQKQPVNPAVVRQGGGKVWEDSSMSEWDPKHFLLFVGNLGPEVSEQLLQQTFSNPYPSVSRVRIIKDKKTDKSKGYGFVAFADGKEFLKALKEMQGRWIGNRQCQIKKSDFNKKF